MGKSFKGIPKIPLVRLSNATFFRQHISSVTSGNNPALFPNTTLDIYPNESDSDYWAVIGPAGSGKTTFLEILKGNHLCKPPLARSYPYLPRVVTRSSRDIRQLRNRDVNKAIYYAGFGGKGAKLGGLETRGSYMAARYESRHETEDFSLRDYLLGNTDANPADFQLSSRNLEQDESRLERIAGKLQLEPLLDQPAFVLSNGQTRRARIAKAFMEYPLLLLLDEPFLGIDPVHHRILDPALWSLSRRLGPNIFLALGNDQPPPRWITHLICLDNCKIVFSGPKDVVYEKALAAGYPLATAGIKRSLWRGSDEFDASREEDDAGVEACATATQEAEVLGTTQSSTKSAIDLAALNGPDSDASELSQMHSDYRPRAVSKWNHQADVTETLQIGEPIIEMKGVQVEYGKVIALGNWQQPEQEQSGLYWTIKRGERWGIFGPNGSGKTTILSLVNSDHPKSYSQSISYFGLSRLPEPGQAGISIFDLQSRIMQASPEVHAFFPKHLSIRATLENAWAETFLAKPQLTANIDKIVDAALRWFSKELNPQHKGSEVFELLYGPNTKPRMRTSERVTAYSEQKTDWADHVRLSEVSFGAQRLALFLRAIIKKPDLVILDEAFSGMDKETRIKCMMFLAYGETRALRPIHPSTGGDPTTDFSDWVKFESPLTKADKIQIGSFKSHQALVVVAHEADEVPPLVNQYLFLEEPGTKKPPRFGEIAAPWDPNTHARRFWWNQLWDPSVRATNTNEFHRTFNRDNYKRRREEYRLQKEDVQLAPSESN